MAYQRYKAFNFGTSYAGALTHAGYALSGASSWTAASEIASPTSGTTGAVSATITFPDDYAGPLLWTPDTTATPVRIALVEINDERIDLTQPLVDVNTATVAGALHGSWALAFGKQVLDRVGRLLELFGFNSQTVPLQTHSLDDGAAPTTRTPQ